MEDKEQIQTETDQTSPVGVDQQLEEFLTAWFQVRQLIQALNFNRAHQQGLSTTQFIVLNFIEEAQEPCTISWLAGRINLDPATVVRTVDSLENRGLVARRRDKQDRRQVFVEFTEAGRQVQQTSQQSFKNSILEIFSAISPTNRQALVEGLKEFVTIGQPPEAERARPHRDEGKHR